MMVDVGFPAIVLRLAGNVFLKSPSRTRVSTSEGDLALATGSKNP